MHQPVVRADSGAAEQWDGMAAVRDSDRFFWNVVERSAGGHERSRRLEWRMTEEEALQWQKANAGELIRVSARELTHEAPLKPDARARHDGGAD